MQTYRKLFILFLCTVILSSSILMCYTIPVFAKPTLDEDGHLHVYNWDDIKDCATDWVMHMASQIGAVFYDHSFSQYVQNKESWVDYWKEDNVIISENGTSVTFSTELMAYIKQCIDDYAAENQPFYLEKTYKMSDVPASYFKSKSAYDYFKSYFESDSYKYILLTTSISEFLISDFTPVVKEGCGFVKYSYGSSNRYYGYRVYDSDWQLYEPPLDRCVYKQDENNNLYFEIVENAVNAKYISRHIEGRFDSGITCVLVTKDGGSVRIFNTLSDYINYSVGQRKIYYTNNYYNYVPSDLQVSIDDLQKTIDDMQDVIDKLLDQITDNTTESEIEELLRQILEEMKNNQGGGSGGDGGGGSGGGDVNVDIDLGATNGLLSKILAKVTQIFDKISSSAGQFMTDVVNSIKELGEMLKKYLITITGDLDDIKGKLEQMTEDEFAEKTDSMLNESKESFSEIGDVAKGKFPFSLPNDMRILIERISLPPAETVSLHSSGPPGVSVYSDHGGGGASRPSPGGIASVEQGSTGNSFGVSPTGAPVIRCPIVVKSVGIDCSIVIDLSEFGRVALLARTLLTLMFVCGLYNLTFKVMGLWGDLVE